MESAIPVSLATARTDADAAVVQHSKATRNESANAKDLTLRTLEPEAIVLRPRRLTPQSRKGASEHRCLMQKGIVINLLDKEIRNVGAR